jgi:HEAT repeat protein
MIDRAFWLKFISVLLFACGSVMAYAGVTNTVARPFEVEQEIFGTLQGLKGERSFGHVGVTGLKLRIHDGLALTVEETVPGTPADGKFRKGEVITGVNGIALKGNNPFIVMGSSLTRAEATDGKLVFGVGGAEGQGDHEVELRIPVLGAYSATWPLECAKSRAIVKQAAEYYARTLKYADGSDEDRADELMTHGVGGALAALFLLSTGDDQYLPRVKAYVDKLSGNIKDIGDQTWHNGYNGIVCAEYYLRTGDKSVLPALQYYCDNAKERQFYGVGWGHWGTVLNPAYTAGGLMNSAGAQVVTTLLLAKECGVKVDETTLRGALRQWYRFAGHGSVPYGDHRAEGGGGSNGKDGMAAVMMQVACGAEGDVGIYREARDSFSMAMLEGYPKLVSGHGDNGRGDGIWRGMGSAFMLEARPADYHRVMSTLRWWFDLSRRPSGGLGMAMTTRFNDEGSGAGLALAYTAPLKTLRITGAPRSRFAVPFSLPGSLWGRMADRDFLSIEHGKPYWSYGTNDPAHVALRILGDAYSSDTNAMAAVPRGEILKNVYHARYMNRAQAGKALLRLGEFGVLEKLLQDPDPRVRRAALDGLIDYRYWFAMGKQPIRTEQVTPAMIASIRKMLSDPDEAEYVVDGALMALSRAPADVIVDSLPVILLWANHDEWWLRQAAFMALAGASRDEATLPKVLPVMLEMLVHETRAQAREGMQYQVVSLWKANKGNTLVDRQIAAAFARVVQEGRIMQGARSTEGAFNVMASVSAALAEDPAGAVALAGRLVKRFPELTISQVASLTGKFLDVLGGLSGDQRGKLADLLYGDYRGELIRRMEAGEKNVPVDTLLALAQIRNPALGWQVLGKPLLDGRLWTFTSFDPKPEDRLHPRIGKRFRDVALPAGLEGWFNPGFDDSRWTSGKAPVGTGVFTAKRGKQTVFGNNSDWGNGEFLVMRNEFVVDSLDCDCFRLRILANQGYRVYLNGHTIYTYEWWQDAPVYRSIGLGSNDVSHLKAGTNVLAIYANVAYKDGARIGQVDAYLEGLKMSDLLGQAGKGKQRMKDGKEEKGLKRLPIDGEVFLMDGHVAFLIKPGKTLAGAPVPWVWYAPTLPKLPGQEEKWMFEQFLARGIAIAGVDVGESYGSPDGSKVFSALYQELVGKRGLAPKACLLARSRGGLMLYNWAVENPDAVACVAGIYPVCNLSSYPGLGKACGAYNLTEQELAAKLERHNPVDRLAPLAAAHVPVFHIHGDKDHLVPLEANSGLLAERYRALGGDIALEVVKGGGHDLSTHWFQSQNLVDFVIRHAGVGGTSRVQVEDLNGVQGKAYRVQVGERHFELLKETVYDPRTHEGRSRHRVYWLPKTRFTQVVMQNNFAGITGPVWAQFHSLTNAEAILSESGKPFVTLNATVLAPGDDPAIFGKNGKGKVVRFTADPASDNQRGGTIELEGQKVPVRLRGPRAEILVRKSLVAEDSFAKGHWGVHIFGASDAGRFVASHIELTSLPDPMAEDDPALPRVLVVGDSISMNYHDATKAALKGIANYYRVEGNGGPSDRGVACMELWLGDYQQKGLHWDVIQFNHGLHDLKQTYDEATGTYGTHQVGIEEYKANLEREIAIMRKTGAKLIWCSTTPVPNNSNGKWPEGTFGRRKDEDRVYNDAALEVMRKHPDILINDLNGHIRETGAFDEWRKGTDVHFWAGDQQKLVGEAVAAAIRKALGK